MKLKNWAFFVVLVIGWSSCNKKEAVVPMHPVQNDSTIVSYADSVFNAYFKPDLFTYSYEQPSRPNYSGTDVLLLTDNLPSNNPITNDGAVLGRVLFYDKNLSRNNTISCASCHLQAYGFSDTAVFSKGFKGGETGMHSMALANARFNLEGRFFWNQRAQSLEEQVLMPIQDEVEMGMELSALEEKLTGIPYYPLLFERAFDSQEVTADRISKSLSQFVRSMVSFNSKYDQGREMHDFDEDFSNFTAQENQGKRLFQTPTKGFCSGCHHTDAQIGDVARNNGLTGQEFPDNGLFDVTSNPLDKGKFKVPSLRNIAVRPPYMHDGSIQSLTEVVEAYSSKIKWSETLDPHLQAPGNKTAIRFNLTNDEVQAIVAFLNTLTDPTFLSNPKHADPFK